MKLTADTDGTEGREHEKHKAEEQEVIVISHVPRVLANVVEQ